MDDLVYSDGEFEVYKTSSGKYSVYAIGMTVPRIVWSGEPSAQVPVGPRAVKTNISSLDEALRVVDYLKEQQQ